MKSNRIIWVALLSVLLAVSLTACGGGGEGSSSGTTTTTPAPSAPTGVSATAGNGQATISWNTVSGATSYNIYWSTTSGVTKTNGTKITGATSPYSHTGLTNGTTYYYIVTAVNSSGESVESAQVSATPTAPTITGFTPKSGTMGSQITLTGTHFNTEISGNTVRINDLVAAVTNASASELMVIVPEGATTGKISLTIGETTITTTDNFTVTDFENKFVVRGLYVQFDRRGFWSGYWTGDVIKELNSFESSLGHTVADEVSLQLDEMKKIGVNTIALELRSSDPGWTGGFDYPACNLNESLGLSYPFPTQSELTNLLALFDLIYNKQIKIMLRLVNTHMEEQPPLNNTQWISAILNVVKDHPALDLVLFEGNTRLVDSDGDGIKDQCGIPAEPPLWLGPSSVPANYVKWAIQYGMILGLPANKLSAECCVGSYIVDAESPAGPEATDLHLWRTVKVLKQIFDDLAVPGNQRTYAISFYQQRKCENAHGIPCVDADPSVWAEETWKNVFEIIGREDSRVVAVEMGLNKYDPNWTTEQAFETHIKLIKRYGVAGGCFWRWVFFDDNEKNDPTLSTPVKKRGLAFEYYAVKDIMARYYLDK